MDGIASGGAKQRKQDNGEPFYGFTDFLRDLDVDLKRWSDQVDKKGMETYAKNVPCFYCQRYLQQSSMETVWKVQHIVALQSDVIGTS